MNDNVAVHIMQPAATYAYYQPNSIDALFINSDIAYETLYSIFTKFKPYLAEGAIIAGNHFECAGVQKFIKEKLNYTNTMLYYSENEMIYWRTI